jgi:hypothetical protein
LPEVIGERSRSSTGTVPAKDGAVTSSPDWTDCGQGVGARPIVAYWSFGHAWRRHAYILPSFLLSLVVCGWFVTWGDWKFFERESFCSFYDAQALSMFDGHLDVPPQAIAFEAYIFHGKTYGYFGIAPALLRIPLLITFNHLDGLWSRLLMMLACAINLICVYRILRLIRGDFPTNTHSQRALDSLFILCAALGSTNVFIIARSFTFHEAIMWGSTFALLFAWTFLKYLRTPSLRLLTLAGAFAFMSFHSRATAGAGALLAMCVVTALLGWRALKRSLAADSSLAFATVTKPLPHALIGAAAVCITLSTYFGVNYAKFRTFSSMPLQYYNLYVQAPGRMQVTGAKQIHPENIPTSVATYFGVRGFRLDREFPWVFLSRQATLVGSPAIDVVEPFSTFPVSMPALTLLAVIGCWSLIRGSSETIRRARLPAATLLIGGGIILMTVGITERYLHDLYPAMIICAAVGVWRLDSGRLVQQKTALMTTLSIISIAMNCAFALVYQRVAPWGVPAPKQAEFVHLQQSIDRLLQR